MVNPFDVMRKQLEKMYFGKCDDLRICKNQK